MASTPGASAGTPAADARTPVAPDDPQDAAPDSSQPPSGTEENTKEDTEAPGNEATGSQAPRPRTSTTLNTALTALAIALLSMSATALALIAASWGASVVGESERPLAPLAWGTLAGLAVLTAGKLWVRADAMSPDAARDARRIGLLALLLSIGWAFYVAEPPPILPPPVILHAGRLLPIAAIVGGIGILSLPTSPPPQQGATSDETPGPAGPQPPDEARMRRGLRRPDRRTLLLTGSAAAAAAATGGMALANRGWLSSLRTSGRAGASWRETAPSSWGVTMPWGEDHGHLSALMPGSRGPLACWSVVTEEAPVASWCLAALSAKDGSILWQREGLRVAQAWRPWISGSNANASPLITTSPDGSLVAVGTLTHWRRGTAETPGFSVVVWDAATGEERCRATGAGSIRLMALTDTHLAVQTAPTPQSRQRIMEVREAATGRVLRRDDESWWLIGAGSQHLYLLADEPLGVRERARRSKQYPTFAVDLVDAASGERRGEVHDVDLRPLGAVPDEEGLVTCAGWLPRLLPDQDQTQSAEELINPETGQAFALDHERRYSIEVVVGGWCVGEWPWSPHDRTAQTPSPALLLPQGTVLERIDRPAVTATDNAVYLKEGVN